MNEVFVFYISGTLKLKLKQIRYLINLSFKLYNYNAELRIFTIRITELYYCS